MNKTVVALILHFRDAVTTRECLEGLVEEGVKSVQIVDNSEDGGKSLKDLLLAVEHFTAIGIHIAVHDPGKNLGFAAGVDAGLRAARSHFGQCQILLINADATLKPGSLQKLIGRLECLGPLSAVAPIMQYPGASSISWSYYHRLLGLILPRRLPGTFPYVSGCCLLLSSALASESVFNQRFFFYGDDIDLGYRAHNGDITIDVVKDAIVLHQGSASSRKGSLFYEYHLPRSHLELVQTLTRSRAERVLAILGRMVTLTLRAVIRACRFRSYIPVRGLVYAWQDYCQSRMRTFTPAA